MSDWKGMTRWDCAKEAWGEFEFKAIPWFAWPLALLLAVCWSTRCYLRKTTE
jgi:hypothetical protein